MATISSWLVFIYGSWYSVVQFIDDRTKHNLFMACSLSGINGLWFVYFGCCVVDSSSNPG
jgi:hypothetical protein